MRFSEADRTALSNRAQTEPRSARPTELGGASRAGHGVSPIATEQGPNWGRSRGDLGEAGEIPQLDGGPSSKQGSRSVSLTQWSW